MYTITIFISDTTTRQYLSPSFPKILEYLDIAKKQLAEDGLTLISYTITSPKKDIIFHYEQEQ